MRKHLLVAAALLIGAGCAAPEAKITSFEECAAAGNPVMESYPRQCRAGGTTFVEQVAAPEPPPQAPATETATLRKGEIATLTDGMTVTLVAIEDSRCPKDVQCIWAGELAALLSVRASATSLEAVEIRLGQTTRPRAEAYGTSFTLTAIDEASATFAAAKP